MANENSTVLFKNRHCSQDPQQTSHCARGTWQLFWLAGCWVASYKNIPVADQDFQRDGTPWQVHFYGILLLSPQKPLHFGMQAGVFQAWIAAGLYLAGNRPSNHTASPLRLRNCNFLCSEFPNNLGCWLGLASFTRLNRISPCASEGSCSHPLMLSIMKGKP